MTDWFTMSVSTLPTFKEQAQKNSASSLEELQPNNNINNDVDFREVCGAKRLKPKINDHPSQSITKRYKIGQPSHIELKNKFEFSQFKCIFQK